MNNHDICLVICFYAGPREGGQQTMFKNYLEAQRRALKRFRHAVTRTVFVISQDNCRREEIREVDGITYYIRNNRNLSFGGWVDAMNRFNHDYYILSEDDYIFCQNNFDTIMLDDYIKKGCEYLVNWKACPRYLGLNAAAGRPAGLWDEMISTIGIMSSKHRDKFRGYNATSRPKGRAMQSFLGRFETISGLDNYDGFIYEFNGSKGLIGTYYFSNSRENGVVRSRDVAIQNIDFSKVLVCCYQFYSKNSDLFGH